MARWLPRLLRGPRRTPTERLPQPPREAIDLPVPRLHVHTAESLVVLTTAPEVIPALREAAAKGTPVRLVCAGTRPATLIPGAGNPVLDPDEGWLIPLPSESQEFLAYRIPAEAGGWELPGTRVGIVLE